VKKVFKATAKPMAEMEGTLFPRGAFDDILNMLEPRTPFSVMDYFGYQRIRGTTELSELHDRTQTEKWLYGVFLKIALPTHRPNHNHMELVYSPLNSTAFFRVLSTLFENGYPAHWLADVLSSILNNNKVHTTARPPRSYPLAISETEKVFPLKRMDISPFLPEFQTLTSLWLAELPFGLSDTVPVFIPSKIREYKVKFAKPVWHGETIIPVFTLLLAQFDEFKSLLGTNSASGSRCDIRRVLLMDEKREKGP
jgi:hypothetical protein